MENEVHDLHLEGDPDRDSTRRHMERVLSGRRGRRWPWLFGLVAGGTALAFWRAKRPAQRDTPVRTKGTRPPL